MSNWPPQNPTNRQQAPQRQHARRAQGSAGCFKAVLVTIMLTFGMLVGIMLFGSVSSDFNPIITDSIGIVRVEGAITESKDLVKAIRKLRKSELVKGIVVRLETPGGGVGASEEIYRELNLARTDNKKLVVASMGDVAASGGYYIAAAADKIYATSGTITGSIGVISPGFNARETLHKLGMYEDSIATGEHKNTGNPFDEQTTSQRVLLQGVINDMYRQFFQVVLKARHEAIAKATEQPAFAEVINAEGTKVPGLGVEWNTFTTGTVASALGVPVEQETALRRLADGRIYTGEQALKVGLVDNIGTLQDAIDYAGETSGLGKDPETVDRTPKSEVSSWLGVQARRVLQEAMAPERKLEYRSSF